MQTTADLKRAEALATEIADVLNAAPQATDRVQVRYDQRGGTYGVRVRVGGHRYDVLMPAPGALYPLWRDGAWQGGMHISTDAGPYEVAVRLLDCIAATV